MVRSMTAYARSEQKFEWGQLEFEIRSVNHRYLDISFRLPEALRPLEMHLRECATRVLNRGKVDIGLRLQLLQPQQETLFYDKKLAKQLATTLHEIDKLIYSAAPVNPVEILQWPGVMEVNSLILEEIKAEVLSGMDDALSLLLECREREGVALKHMIVQRCDAIATIIQPLKQAMPEIIQAQRERLVERLAELENKIDNDRLEQEIVYLLQKSDIDEEIDRLETHLTEVGRVLEDNDPIGRRLDFLMQEFNRETNTLGSKSVSTLTTQAAVDLKVLIEQMREQIQNIE